MGKLRIRHVPRERDEQLLGWLARRTFGESANAIARSVGQNAGQLIAATNAIRTADITESGEDRSVVERGYW